MRNIIIPSLEIPGVIKLPEIGLAMKGEVQVKVIDGQTREVIREYPKQRNLILNAGMDQIAGLVISECFTNAVVGTGTTPTTDSGGITTASQSGTTVTLVGGSYVFVNTATDAGKMIKWSTTEEAMIVTVTSATIAVVNISQTVAATTFTVYRTNQVGLATETKRSSTYLTGASNCSSVWTGASHAMKRTYDFTTEVGGVTYTEVGFSSTASAGNNLFSRILLGAGVSLIAGQAVRLVYTLTVVVSPTTPTAIGASPITGWAGATGTVQIQRRIMSSIGSTGVTGDGTSDTSACLEPCNTLAGSAPFVFLWSGSTAHNTFRSDGPARTSLGSQALSTLASYTALSFFRDKSTTFAVGTANATTIRTIGLCDTNDSGANQSLVYIMASDQTKDNLHTLTISYRITWGRVLA